LTPFPALVLKMIKLPTSHSIYFVLVWSLSLFNFGMFLFLHAGTSTPVHLLCVLKDSGFYVNCRLANDTWKHTRPF